MLTERRLLFPLREDADVVPPCCRDLRLRCDQNADDVLELVREFEELNTATVDREQVELIATGILQRFANRAGHVAHVEVVARSGIVREGEDADAIGIAFGVTRRDHERTAEHEREPFGVADRDAPLQEVEQCRGAARVHPPQLTDSRRAGRPRRHDVTDCALGSVVLDDDAEIGGPSGLQDLAEIVAKGLTPFFGVASEVDEKTPCGPPRGVVLWWRRASVQWCGGIHGVHLGLMSLANDNVAEPGSEPRPCSAMENLGRLGSSITPSARSI